MFLSHGSKGELILILDLQSSMVRSSLVYLNPNSHTAEIIFSDIVEIPHKKHANSGYVIKMALKAVSETVTNVLRFISRRKHEDKDNILPHHIDSVHFALSSPWIISQAKVLSLKFGKPTTVTRKGIMNLIEKERQDLVSDDSDKFDIIEEKIFDVSLNGYSVSSWEKKMADELEVSYAMSVAGTAMIERLRSTCDNVVRRSRIHFHSSMLLLYMGIRAENIGGSSYMINHIHGELSDIAVIERNSCAFFGSYQLGVNSIRRKISEKTKMREQSADSLMSLTTGGHLDDSDVSKKEKPVEDMQHGWVGEFDKLLKNASYTKPLPKKAYVVALSHPEFFIRSLGLQHKDILAEELKLDTHKVFADAIVAMEINLK